MGCAWHPWRSGFVSCTFAPSPVGLSGVHLERQGLSALWRNWVWTKQMWHSPIPLSHDQACLSLFAVFLTSLWPRFCHDPWASSSLCIYIKHSQCLAWACWMQTQSQGYLRWGMIAWLAGEEAAAAIAAISWSSLQVWDWSVEVRSYMFDTLLTVLPRWPLTMRLGDKQLWVCWSHLKPFRAG
jgi:hypothetical protein